MSNERLTIGELSRGAVVPVKTLRFYSNELEERVVMPIGATRGEPVDLRIVAATHHDLPKRAMHRNHRKRPDC